MAPLEGQRILVVGGSAGIGRAFAVRSVAAGAEVVVAARRADTLAEVVAAAGGGTGVAADVCDEAGRARLVADTVAALGEVDLVMYAVGFAELRGLAASSEDVWRRTFDTNVVALNALLRAIVPHLAAGATVAVLSSETAATPRAGLVHYAASKAALETSVRGWRAEHPEIRWSCVVVGATQPTDFGRRFDVHELRPALDNWTRHGLMQEQIMDTGDVAAVLVDTLGTLLAHPGVGIEQLVLRSPSPVLGSSGRTLEETIDGAVGPVP
jgi:NAD(P)-dependent dehydrogenase (short-subunit alcohol dehydrogenase family)